MSAGSSAPGFVGSDVPSDAIANTCIKCGLCLPTCPTYQLTLDERSSPRGRIHLIQGVLEGTLGVDDPTFRAQMGECLGCRNCEPVCPSGVAFGALLEDARAQIARAEAATPAAIVKKIAFDVPLRDLRFLRMLARAARMFEISGMRAIVRRSGVLDRFGLSRLDALLPTPRGYPLAADGALHDARTATPRGTVSLLVGCVMGALFGDVHRATIRVLNRNGWNVEATRGQGCCGALHLHAGFKDTARAFAKRNIEAFERSNARWIVVNVAGCGAVMKEYDRLLAGDVAWESRAANFVARVRDASEVLAQAPLTQDGLAPMPVKVAYQDPCHLAHAQRIKTQPRQLIDAIPGVERVEFSEADRCCGSAGVYNLTHPQMADRLADARIAAAVEAGAHRIVTSNPGCQMQLAAASRRAGGPTVQHLMEFVDEAYGGDDDLRHNLPGGLLFAAGAIVVASAILWFMRWKR